MNIRMAVFMYEQLLQGWRSAVEREYIMRKEAATVIRMVNPDAKIEEETDEQHQVEVGLSRLSAKKYFYAALGIEPPKQMFDPTRDENQYDMYPDSSEGSSVPH